MNAKPNFLLFGVQPKNWMLILPFSNIIDSAECDWMIFGRMTNSVWFSAKRWTMEKILANDRYCRLTFSTERHSAIWPVLSLFSSRFCRMVVLPDGYSAEWNVLPINHSAEWLLGLPADSAIRYSAERPILPINHSAFQHSAERLIRILPYGILPNVLFCRSVFCQTFFCLMTYSADRRSAKRHSAIWYSAIWPVPASSRIWRASENSCLFTK